MAISLLTRDAPAAAGDVSVPARRRLLRRMLIAIVIVLLLPVPWQHRSDSRVGMAWRLDGRLAVEGEHLDPPGRYSWLTVGRPVLVGELAWQATFGPGPERDGIRDLRAGDPASRPVAVEPVAAAVGLEAAGHAVNFETTVTVADPVSRDLPYRGVVTHLNGHRIRTRSDYRAQLAAATEADRLTFRIGGADHTVEGARLPYRSVQLADRTDVSAALWGEGAPYRWLRSMSLGSSHGLMVAMVSYAANSDEDLAAGRHVAGTGRIDAEGTVGTIGGLRTKAAAARRAGADVLLVPWVQRAELDGFESGSMEILAVKSLQDAIEQLRVTAGRQIP